MEKLMFKKINFVFLLAMLSANLGWTQEKIPVTVAAGQPPRSLPSLAKVNEFFIPEVNKRIKAAGLKYQIDWTEAYAGSLLKPLQMLDGTKDGVTGIGFIPIGFYPDKLPLEQLSFTVPFATTDVLTISRIMNRLHKAFPEFGAQYEKFNQVRLGGRGVDSYELLTTFPVKSIDDIKGKKISSGGLILSWLRGTGATPVQGNMMEYYNSTKSGVYQGFIIMPSTFPGMKYPEVAPFITRVGFGAQYAVVLTINKDLYKKLPEPIQKIMHEVGEEWGIESDKAYARAGDDGYNSLPGFKASAVSFTRDQQVAWAKSMPNLAKEWAANADKQGLPGTKALAMFMEELRKAGIKPIRDWDKE
jgi:TRAP-type C4-dicarboxylate transport system substrate-binding protein